MATKPIKKKDTFNRLVKSWVMLLNHYEIKRKDCLNIAIDDIIENGYIPLRLDLDETESGEGQGLYWRVSGRLIYVGKNKARIWKYCNNLIQYYKKSTKCEGRIIKWRR